MLGVVIWVFLLLLGMSENYEGKELEQFGTFETCCIKLEEVGDAWCLKALELIKVLQSYSLKGNQTNKN